MIPFTIKHLQEMSYALSDGYGEAFPLSSSRENTSKNKHALSRTGFGLVVFRIRLIDS